MSAVILPAREADQAVGALPLACFEHLQGREHADHVKREIGEQSGVFRHLILEHDVVDDQVVALARHGGDGVAHAAKGPLRHRSALDDDRGLAVLLHGLEGEAVAMIPELLRHHVQERVHLDMQERLPRDGLQRLGDRALADAADAVKEDDGGQGGPMRCERIAPL